MFGHYAGIKDLLYSRKKGKEESERKRGLSES